MKKLCLEKRIVRIMNYLVLVAFLLFSGGCDIQKKSEPEKRAEMLIYCGITMIKPMLEIAKVIEEEENVDIVITKGGSGNLLKSLLYSKTGDLYLPGSDKYYQMIEKKHPGTILEKVFVGHNKAVLMVQKGNPRGINNDLTNLTRQDYAVVIGNPSSGSIGKETKAILEKRGIYDSVLSNAMLLTTDSKDLVKMLLNKEADLVVNWYAVCFWDGNRNGIDVLEIDPEFAKRKKLVLGLLKYSQNPEVARKFMSYASSEKGKAIFKKHGFFFN